LHPEWSRFVLKPTLATHCHACEDLNNAHPSLPTAIASYCPLFVATIAAHFFGCFLRLSDVDEDVVALDTDAVLEQLVERKKFCSVMGT
jgi:hypothetical protein